jgi:hypothetical protein
LDKGRLKAEEVEQILRRIAASGTVVLNRLREDQQ